MTLSPELSIEPAAPSDRMPLLIAMLVFAALSLAASVTSQGFLEADGCTHYLYALYALRETHYLVNVWGRPLCTALYAVPATLAGRFGVRTASLLLALGCALVARSIAITLGDRRPTLAAIFTLAQPLFFLHSFSELTELPFALLLGAAFLAYCRRRFGIMALLVALSPLCRPEGFGFLVFAVIALICHRRFLWLLLLPIPLLLWDYAGWTIYGHPDYPGLAERLPPLLRWLMWLPNNWPYADKSAYLPGSLFHFAMLLPTVISPLIFPAMCLGIWRTFREGSSHWQGKALRQSPDHPITQSPNHLLLCRWLSGIVPLLILIGHSVLYWQGRMASSGEVRYMLVVAPFWGILSARGWMWLFDRQRWPFVMRAAAAAAMAPLLANAAYPVVPLTYATDWLQAKSLASWLEETPLRDDYPRILTAHPGVFYFMGISSTDRTRALEWTKVTIDKTPPGAILVWDNVYGVYNADTTRSVTAEEILDAGWVEQPVPLANNGPRGHGGTWRIFVSPHTISGTPTVQLTSTEFGR